MSLSSVIIHGTVNQVEQLIKAGEPINVMDEYGYTPLIQSAIMNNVEMARLLIQHGAEVVRRDLTGNTALHWAVDNNNLTLCQLLLEQGADANAYTEAGESVAVKPILRQQTGLRELLYRHGANFNFANDYINAKLLGHRFELKGYVDIVNQQGYFVEIDLEGFFLEFTLDAIYRSLLDFHDHFLSKHLQEYFPAVRHLLQVFRIARKLIKYEHYQVDVNACRQQIDDLLTYPIILIPVSYEGHAITFVKSGLLVGKCDRSRNETFQQNVVIYKMGKAGGFDPALLRRIMYSRQSKQFIDTQLSTLLDLQPLFELPIGQQIAGNCSWANVEASVPVILFFGLLMGSKQGAGDSDVERYRKFVIFFYQQWREWDKDRSLHYVVQQFDNASPARKASLIALLAAVLFQRCSLENERDLARARKILPILRTRGYEYVLNSYVEVYCHHHPSQAGKNLQRILRLIDDF